MPAKKASHPVILGRYAGFFSRSAAYALDRLIAFGISFVILLVIQYLIELFHVDRLLQYLSEYEIISTALAGVLSTMGIYYIVQVLHLLGNPDVLTVTGSTHQEVPMYEDRRKESAYDVEELGIGLVRLVGGITFFIEEAWAVHLAGTDGSKIVGPGGGISLSPFAYHTTLADMEMDASFDLNAADTRWHRCIENYDGFDSAQHHWVAALQGRVDLVDTAALGLTMMRIAEGIYLSQERGSEVTTEEIETASVSSAIDL